MDAEHLAIPDWLEAMALNAVDTTARQAVLDSYANITSWYEALAMAEATLPVPTPPESSLEAILAKHHSLDARIDVILAAVGDARRDLEDEYPVRIDCKDDSSEGDGGRGGSSFGGLTRLCEW